LKEHFELPRIIDDWHPAVFHAPTAAIPYGVKSRMVVTVPDLTPYHYPRNFIDRFYFSFYLRLVLRRAKHIIVYSKDTARDCTDNLGIPQDKITVSWLGVDDCYSQKCDASEIEAFKQRSGLKDRYVLCVANPKPHKNVITLLEAWEKVSAEMPEVQLVVVSAPGDWMDERMKNVPNCLRLQGIPEQDMPLLYQGAWALVIPSLYEGFGLPAAEAKCSGIPVIAARAASLPEIVGGNGLLFEPRKAGELADCLKKLYMDNDLAVKFAELGKAETAKFNWTQTAEKHLKVYLSAIQ
ncbi:MAG: glycosyltransferase family 4 protein, partial [bacterium]|nr:glycosyltransferase family 4 protein [bacterium]